MQLGAVFLQVKYLNDDEATRPVRGWTPHDEHNLKVDLLEYLLDEGFVRPVSVTRMTVRDWFPTRELDLADHIVDDLVSNPDAPVEHVTPEARAIWLLDAAATREFVADLRRNPSWFDV